MVDDLRRVDRRAHRHPRAADRRRRRVGRRPGRRGRPAGARRRRRRARGRRPDRGRHRQPRLLLPRHGRPDRRAARRRRRSPASTCRPPAAASSTRSPRPTARSPRAWPTRRWWSAPRCSRGCSIGPTAPPACSSATAPGRSCCGRDGRRRACSASSWAPTARGGDLLKVAAAGHRAGRPLAVRGDGRPAGVQVRDHRVGRVGRSACSTRPA